MAERIQRQNGGQYLAEGRSVMVLIMMLRPLVSLQVVEAEAIGACETPLSNS